MSFDRRVIYSEKRGWKRGVALAAALALLVCSGFVEGQTYRGGPVVGAVSEVKGRVEVRRFGKPTGLWAEERTEIFRDDLLEVARGGEVKILFSDESVVTAAGGSRFKIEQYVFRKKERRSIFSLLKGRVRAFVSGHMRNDVFEIRTPTAVAGVRGTDFEVEHDEASGVSKCRSYGGRVEWGNRFGKVILEAGFSSVARPGRAPERPVSAVPPSGMKKVAAGRFRMGCNEKTDNRCENDEKPGREANLEDFWIDEHEVTVEEYNACVKVGKCARPKDSGDSEYCNWGYFDRGKHPVNCVDWSQAKNYCEWKGKRLPTEKEWEKAARGTDGRKYPWGNKEASCDYAVMADGKSAGKSGKTRYGCGKDRTWPVCSKREGDSPYGLCDMAGNVWEWTADLYEGTIGYRYVRGGSWYYGARDLRSSGRSYYDPEKWYNTVGFRCVW